MVDSGTLPTVNRLVVKNVPLTALIIDRSNLLFYQHPASPAQLLDNSRDLAVNLVMIKT